VDRDYLRFIGEELRQTNSLCKQFEVIGNYLDVLPEGNSTTALEFRSLNPTIDLQTLDFDIYCVTSEFQSGNRNITVKRTHNEGLNTIDGADPLTEPLSYPVLFDCGQPQYSPILRKELSFSQYIACRMLMPEQSGYGDGISSYLGHSSTVHPNRFFPSNRFRIFYKLGMTYLVDMISRAQDYTLRWHGLHQDKIMGGDFQEPAVREVAEVNGDDNSTNSVVKQGITNHSSKHFYHC
jgi:hypothetical protein